MDDIMREKLNIGLTLNFNERLYRQSLNKKFGTHINKSMIFKLVLSQNKRPHNLETFEDNHKKFGT